LAEEAIMKKGFSVKQGDNCVTIKISGQTYAKIYDKKGMPVLLDSSQTDMITAIIEPGDYTIETDGKVASVTSSVANLEEVQ
jgi:hypothetical protein